MASPSRPIYAKFAEKEQGEGVSSAFDELEIKPAARNMPSIGHFSCFGNEHSSVRWRERCYLVEITQRVQLLKLVV
jgi:hypothetical protein